MRHFQRVSGTGRPRQGQGIHARGPGTAQFGAGGPQGAAGGDDVVHQPQVQPPDVGSLKAPGGVALPLGRGEACLVGAVRRTAQQAGTDRKGEQEPQRHGQLMRLVVAASAQMILMLGDAQDGVGQWQAGGGIGQHPGQQEGQGRFAAVLET